jgi:hypothetical protein
MIPLQGIQDCDFCFLTAMKALQAFAYGYRSIDFLMKACRAFINVDSVPTGQFQFPCRGNIMKMIVVLFKIMIPLHIF